MVTRDLVYPGPYDDTVEPPMILKPVQTDRDVSLKARVPGELDAALTASTGYDHERSVADLRVALVVQGLERFVEPNRDFQTSRRWTQNGPGAGPVTS
jgi:hypothetical protein